MWNTILFDLDGTLTDSQEGIINSIICALEHFGIHEERASLLALERKYLSLLLQKSEQIFNTPQEE